MKTINDEKTQAAASDDNQPKNNPVATDTDKDAKSELTQIIAADYALAAEMKRPAENDYARSWSYCEVTKKFVPLAASFSSTRLFDIATEVSGGILFAKLGPEYLAANALMIPMQRFLVATGSAYLFSMGTLLREQKGNPEEIGKIVQQGILLSLLISIPSITLASCSGPLLRGLGQSKELAAIVEDFYLGALPSIPCALTLYAWQQLTLGIERPSLSLAISIINNLMLNGVGIILTLGLPGLLPLGARGFGYAYAISYGVTTVGAGVYFCCSKNFKHYKLTRFDDRQFAYLKDLNKLGFPLGLQVAADYLMRFGLIIMVGWLGSNALTAARITEIAYIPLFTIIIRAPQVVSNMTKDAVKAKNKALIKQAILVNIGTLTALTSAWTVASLGLSKQLIDLFVDTANANNQQLITDTNRLFWLYPIGLSAEIVRYGIAGSMKGLGNTKSSMWNSLGLLVIVGIALIFLAYFLGLGLPGLYRAADLVLGLAAGSLTCQWSSSMRDLDVPGNTPAAPPGCFTRAYSAIKSWTPCFHASTSAQPARLAQTAQIEEIHHNAHPEYQRLENNPLG